MNNTTINLTNDNEIQEFVYEIQWCVCEIVTPKTYKV